MKAIAFFGFYKNSLAVHSAGNLTCLLLYGHFRANPMTVVSHIRLGECLHELKVFVV